MGLHICYELSLPVTTDESEVIERLMALRAQALCLPFAGVSEFVRLTEHELRHPRKMRGLAFEWLEDVVHISGGFVQKELYAEFIGVDLEQTSVHVPTTVVGRVLGFAVAPGTGCEPAVFALARIAPEGRPTRWFWHYCCKTQYASVISDDHFLRCHTSLIALLDGAAGLGVDCHVRDETGFFASRDTSQLLERVRDMNRIVARFAGGFSDLFGAAGGDPHQVDGEIFHHPDFERLETED